MKNKIRSFTRYYRVWPNDTAVIPVAVVTFPIIAHQPNATYRLLHRNEQFMMYSGLVTALAKAKVGALAFIEHLNRKGEAGFPELLQYRIDHYEDLNVNLVDADIRRVEQQIKADPQFEWQPYRINFD